MSRLRLSLALTLVLAAACTAGENLPFPEPRCTGDEREACLAAQTQIQPDDDLCEGSQRRVCIAPLGRVDPDLVRHLADHFRDEYGLSVYVLTPNAVPEDLPYSLGDQFDAFTMIEYMGSLFPDAYRDHNAILIALTPVDLYDRDSHFRYVFGLKGSPDDPTAVISTSRMYPETYGERPDQDLFFARVRKLFSKYVGYMYYGLPLSDDPHSLMFDSILGPGDLDRMQEPLPVPGR